MPSHDSIAKKSRLSPIYVIVLYVVVYIILTWFFYEDDRSVDGPLSLWIPFPFYFGWWLCRVPCGPYLQWKGIILDLIIFLIPVIIFFLLKRYQDSSVRK